MILVTGAGGKTGRAVVKALARTEKVHALVHRGEYVPLLQSLGADQVSVGDMRDGAALQTALRGARSVYHICPNMHPDEVGIGTLVIGAAREIGIEHFVYHSVLHPQVEQMPHHWNKSRVEEMLFASGLPFSILQPAPYMQNLLVGWKGILEDNVLRVPYSVNSQFSFTDLEDLAAAAVVVLTQPGHVNATYELAGTAPSTYIEVAETFSRVLNRTVQAGEEEIGDWKLRAAGMSEYAVESLIKMFAYYDQYGLAGNPRVLRWLLGREPTSLEAFVERTMNERDAVT